MIMEPCVGGRKARLLTPEPSHNSPAERICFDGHQLVYFHGPCGCPLCRERRRYTYGLIAAGIIVGMLIVRIAFGQ